jgi:hypothetical protein
MTPEEVAEDATRDALAMCRAIARGDEEGLAAVRDNLAHPGLTALLLREWEQTGCSIESIERWASAAGL